MVGVLLSVLLAILTHPWTWTYLMPNYWLYIAAIVAVFVLNKYVLIGYVGDAFLSNGDHIFRPAAWLAFTFIMSTTNLVIGLLLAVYRIVLLLLTTVLSLGKLEVTIFTFFASLDLPHNSFLAGLHMHEAMSHFHDPIYLPGPRGRAHRRWRKLRDTIRRLAPEELRLLATLGRPKEVQAVLDHVVVDMQAAKALAAGGSHRALNVASLRPLDAASRRPLDSTSWRPVDASSHKRVDPSNHQRLDAASRRPLDASSRPSGGPKHDSNPSQAPMPGGRPRQQQEQPDGLLRARLAAERHGQGALGRQGSRANGRAAVPASREGSATSEGSAAPSARADRARGHAAAAVGARRPVDDSGTDGGRGGRVMYSNVAYTERRGARSSNWRHTGPSSSDESRDGAAGGGAEGHASFGRRGGADPGPVLRGAQAQDAEAWSDGTGRSSLEREDVAAATGRRRHQRHADARGDGAATALRGGQPSRDGAGGRGRAAAPRAPPDSDASEPQAKEPAGRRTPGRGPRAPPVPASLQRTPSAGRRGRLYTQVDED